MKYKTTAKALREAMRYGEKIVSIGYCGAGTLLRNHAPIAYTCGVYGWNFDVYNVYGLTICTGYRGMVGPTAKNVHEYEKKASTLVEEEINKPSGEHNWHDLDEKIETLLKEFCAQAI